MSDNFFKNLGKIFAILLVLSVMGYSGYYLGKIQKPQSQTPTLVPTPSQTTPNPTVTSTPWKIITGGVSKSAGLSFDQYTISTPDDWTSKEEKQTALDQKLILEKNGYIISIFQAATGGALCLYPNDPEFEGPSSKFTFFKALSTQDNRTLRRSGEDGGLNFTICQKSGDGSYGQPTNYGHISIKLPQDRTQEGIEIVDKIISSLKKI